MAPSFQLVHRPESHSTKDRQDEAGQQMLEPLEMTTVGGTYKDCTIVVPAHWR